ncbi:MAG: exodeoxyribonuclease VII large subunit [Muribaculaceae bacterium]
MAQQEVITLQQLNRRILDAINGTPGLQGVWVVAETSDLRVTGGHCYFEMIQKHPESGAQLARGRAVIWASQYQRLNGAFMAATGSPLQTGIKIMARVNVSYHAVYGLSMVVTDINPEYTMGDLLRRRNEMIARLKREGIIDMNRELGWPEPLQRIAVISARGAAGYGDFINQLYHNASRLRFVTRLFPAVMQGDNTAPTVISALEAIASAADSYDCVVIIRGGGGSSDLASFDNYDLAANIAQFPLPVIVGIGHERDVTLLDYVAALRVKTPTAAAEWLISRGEASMQRVRDLGAAMLQSVSDRIAGNHRQLAYIAGQLPAMVRSAITRQRDRLSSRYAQDIRAAVSEQLRVRRLRLDALSDVLEALSPEATLRRGYSITRVNGRAVTDATAIGSGVEVTTTLAHGTIISVTK